jgi:subtilisin family serine protease
MSRHSRPRNAWWVLGALAVPSFLLSLPGAAEAQGRAQSHVPGQYIILFNERVADPESAATQIARRHGLALGHVYKAAIRGFSASIPEARLLAVASDPRVRYVEPDRVVSLWAKPQGGSTPSQLQPTGLRRINGLSSPTARIDGLDERVNVDVAILDTGIQTNHPDLKVMGGVNFASGRSYSDGNGHGTHVAGTIGALDNSAGVVGVAPGARLWAVRVLDNSGSGLLSWIVAGVNWVTANADTIEVANMSLGFNGRSPALDQAIANSVAAGVTFVVAAGNSGADAAGFSPANHPDVVCVSAIADSDGMPGGGGAPTAYGPDDFFASFSNWGEVVKIAAPGVAIRSTYKGSGYATMSGTSMASPHVAGAAALYCATHPNAAPWEVEDALLDAAIPADSILGYTGGVVDGVAAPLLNVAGF